MKRLAAHLGMLGVLVFALGAGTARAEYTFTTPEDVNILERWNPDGTYGHTASQNRDDVRRAVMYKPAGNGDWRFYGADQQATIWGRFDFAEPVVLGRLMVQWRNYDHTPTSYTFRDQNGDIVTDVYHTSDPYYHDLPDNRPASEYLEIVTPGESPNNFFDCPRLGAYVDDGETLVMDGTYDVFWEEEGKYTRYGYNSSALTNHLIYPWMNAGDANWTAWELSQPYNFVGAFLTHMKDTETLNDATIEVSSDSTDGQDGSWTTVYGPNNFATGYMVFDQQVAGDWVRLSWSDSGSGGGKEITEFQLFGTEPPPEIPEPATMALLGVGGFGLLLRRRRAGNKKSQSRNTRSGGSTMKRLAAHVGMLGMVLLVLGAGSAHADYTFTNPEDVNVLERWNATGTTYNMTGSEGIVTGAIDYSPAGSSWRVGKPGSGQTKTAWLEWDFGRDITIGEVGTFWRAADHSAKTYRFLDDTNTVIATSTNPTRFPWGPDVPTMSGPATTSKLRLEVDLDNDPNDPNPYHLSETVHVWANPVASETVPMDGTQNLFYEPGFVRTGGQAGWTALDMGSNGNKPSSAGGTAVYEFTQDYNIVGAVIPHYDSGRYLADAKIELSKNGTDWITVFEDADGEWHFRTEASPRELGYVVWDVSTDENPDLNARYVRLSWGPNTNVVELCEFQVFGAEPVPEIPEPATMALLGVGGLGLLLRRRK